MDDIREYLEIKSKKWKYVDNLSQEKIDGRLPPPPKSAHREKNRQSKSLMDDVNEYRNKI